MSKNLIVILKSEEQDGNDRYQQLLSESGFQVANLVVLKFTFINLHQLCSYLIESSSDFNGLILSSPRAVDAIEKSLQTDEERVKFVKFWRSKLIFCGGPKTRQHLHNKLKLNPCCEQQGNVNNAAQLADHILTQHRNSFSTESQKILDPCSEIAMETLPQELKENQIDVISLPVYQTRASETCESELIDLINSHPKRLLILVFFSPSGIRAVKKVLDSDSSENLKYVSIGPTTSRYLQENGYEVFAVSEKPTPESLTECFKNKLEH